MRSSIDQEAYLKRNVIPFLLIAFIAVLIVSSRHTRTTLPPIKTQDQPIYNRIAGLYSDKRPVVVNTSLKRSTQVEVSECRLKLDKDGTFNVTDIGVGQGGPGLTGDYRIDGNKIRFTLGKMVFPGKIDGDILSVDLTSIATGRRFVKQ